MAITGESFQFNSDVLRLFRHIHSFSRIVISDVVEREAVQAYGLPY